MNVLVVGPSPDKSKGGMASVIADIKADKELTAQFNISVFGSYIDGNKFTKILYSAFAFVNFFLTKRNYDLYHIHLASKGSTFRKAFYIKIAKKWGKKVIIHIHGGKYIEFYNNSSSSRRKMIVNLLKSADMVIALSQSWKDKYEKTFGLENCEVLENGINVERLSVAISAPEMYKDAFLCLARMVKGKGIYDLVDAVEIAVKTVPNIKLYLAGDGEVEQIYQMVKEKNLSENIEVVGWAEFEKKIELLKHVSTIVLPSYNEGLPMSILEGMACKKAVISTTVGAIPEVVKEENGILIDPGNINALAESLIKCSRDLELITKMGEHNYFKIKDKYSMTAKHKKLASYYERVCL